MLSTYQLVGCHCMFGLHRTLGSQLCLRVWSGKLHSSPTVAHVHWLSSTRTAMVLKTGGYWGKCWCVAHLLLCFLPEMYGPFTEQIFGLLQQNPVDERNKDATAAQWQYTLQTYGLARPSRDGTVHITSIL